MQPTNHEWSKEALFAKAQVYAASMAEHEDSKWEFGLWSAFLLEMLVRSAVASTSPVLLADNKDWNNILYAMGGTPKKSKFVARSAAISELILRVESLCAEFTREHANFCASHASRRNSEIHSGELPFLDLGTSDWLPMFYSVCEVLVGEIGETLETLFGKSIAGRASEEIAALQDSAGKSIKKTIAAHQTVWETKSDEDKASATQTAQTTSLRHYGHRVDCPSCGNIALLTGNPAGEAKREVDDEMIVEKQVMKPEAFNCIACGLQIKGYSKLLAAGLGDTYLSTSHFDAVDYFDMDLAVEEHMRNLMDDDNNEY